MKKILTGILCGFMIFTMGACNSSNESSNNQSGNNQSSEENKIELTTSNYTKYIDVKSEISVDNFTVKSLAGVYLVDGNATLTLTVYPKQPVKCYNVQIEYTNNSPYDSLGIELSLGNAPNLLVPSDGNLIEEYDIDITTGDVDTLREQIVLWGRTREQMISNIESPFNFNMLADLLSISGYVVVE